jgi:hypothetical protein
MRPLERLTDRDVVELAEGAVTASEVAQLEESLARFPAARQRLERVRAVAGHLGDVSAIEDVDLLPDLRRRLVEEGGSRPGRHRSRWWSPRVFGLAAAAAALAVLLPTVLLDRRHAAMGPENEYRAKSALPAHDARSRWIALNAFRLSGEAAPQPIHDVLHKEDGLLFSYTNLGPEPFSYLMIFGIDEDRHVYWYYPAFLDARDNPKGIDIVKGGSRVGLQEVIAHPYREGTLILFGLFSDRAVSVSDIELAARRGLRDAAGLESAFDGVRVKSLRVKVVP